MKIYLRVLVLYIAFLFPAISQSDSLSFQNADQSDLLQRQVKVGGSDSSPTYAIFTRILIAARVPGGVVELPYRAKPTLHNYPSSTATLRELLDSLIEIDPNYTWRIDGGVVNLIPAREHCPLLDYKIREFNLEDCKTLGEATGRLSSMPELSQGAAQFNISDSCLKLIVRPVERSRKEGFSVKLRDVSSREALNEIVRVHGKGVWHYREYYSVVEGKNCFDIDLSYR